MSYNILAHGYDHKGWLNYASDLSLNFWYRFPRILKEIELANADVVCLQEFNQSQIYVPRLKSLGYEVISRIVGTRSKSGHLDFGQDNGVGLAIAYKKNVLKLIGEPYIVNFEDLGKIYSKQYNKSKIAIFCLF
jgi:mRNA deadenylase 3'-5' endonuclease subunit Ccr4